MLSLVSRQAKHGKFILPDIIDSDRRPTLMSYAASLRAYGAEEAEIHAALLKANRERCQPRLSSYADLKGLARMAQWAGKQAVATRRRAISESDAQCLLDAEHALESHFWKGIAARNAKSVAVAQLAKMRADNVADGSVADVRTLAEATGLSRQAVSSALRKLSGVKRDKHVLVLFTRQAHRTVKKFTDGRDPVRYAYAYSIRQDETWCKNVTRYLSRNSTYKSACHEIAPSALHDAFRIPGKGLTRSASTVYDALPMMTQEDVQKETGLSLRAVKLAFAALVEEELIEKKDGFWVRTVERLDDVAVRRGTAGAAKRQKDGHAHERMEYRKRLRNPHQEGKLKLVKKFGGTVPERRPSISESETLSVEEMSVPVHVSENDQFVEMTLTVFHGARVERECLPM